MRGGGTRFPKPGGCEACNMTGYRGRAAVVEDQPGITRDRLYAEAEHRKKRFTVVDTGGIVFDESDPLIEQVRVQAGIAMEEADVILFVMDGRDGLTPADREVAEMLRRVEKPVFFVVNKVDGDRQELGIGDFYGLGVDNVFAVSAEHNRGVGDLMDEVIRALPQGGVAEEDDEVTKIAVVGRPNVGKSSLVNRLLGFLATAYLARRLGASSFGLISIGFSVLGYVTLFSSPGLHIMGIRKVAASNDSERLWTSDVTMLRFLLSLAGILLTGVISLAIMGLTPTWIMIVFWSCSAIPLALSLDWYFQGKSDLGPASVGRMLIYIIYLAGLFVAVRSPEDVTWTALAFFAANVAGALFLGIVFTRKIGFLELGPLRPGEFRHLAPREVERFRRLLELDRG